MAWTMDSPPCSDNLIAIVDMGSNGIRFSISDLSKDTARTLPCVYQDRLGISLYDAQWLTSTEKMPIPSSTIEEIIHYFVRFRRTCQDFGVKESNIHILATEATRVAVNSGPFRDSITEATGWNVELLSKEEEGRLGALGIASSFYEIHGLVMDLGGGSTQLSWLVADERGLLMPDDKGFVSLPYGAAAMTRLLAEADKTSEGRERLKQEVSTRLRDALATLKMPKDVVPDHLGLYLSGGGFRGWGFLLMHQHPVSPYPIPMINGFSVEASTFQSTVSVQDVAQSGSVFRVSRRRAAQVPAVAFLVSALTDVLPAIKQVFFCQGGIREGFLFSRLSSDIQRMHPLVSATSPFAPPSSKALTHLVRRGVPDPDSLRGWQKGRLEESNIALDLFTESFLNAAVNLSPAYRSLWKDVRAASALRCTTSGLLAGVLGLDHEECALLALTLCERWGGVRSLSRVDEELYKSLRALLGSLTSWWATYVGRVIALVEEVYPAGIIRKNEVFLELGTAWNFGGDFHESILELHANVATEDLKQHIMTAAKEIEDLRKEKYRTDGVGFNVDFYLTSGETDD